MTQKRLRELLNYDPSKGTFIWICSPCWNVQGKIAGCLNPNGYRTIRIDGIGYREHRLAWFYMKKKWPAEIHHINHVKSDNRMCNLQSISKATNLKDKRTYKNNTSGMK